MRKAGDTSFNIYAFLHNQKIEALMMLSLLSQEFGFGDISDLPRDYYGEFFWFLTETVSILEDQKKRGDSSFDWQLSDPAQLVALLGKVKKSDIPDVAVLVKINQLIKLIKESAAGSAEPVKMLAEQSSENPIAVVQESPVPVQKIKITKSQLS